MINFIFSGHFLICIVFFIGVYRLYDGHKRLRFEAQDDDRVNDIPDQDVQDLWHTLSQMNIDYGKFFIRYGWYMIAIAVINAFMYWILNLDVPFEPSWESLPWLFILAFLLFMGCAILNDNGAHAKSLCVGISFIKEKKWIYYCYQQFNFYPRNSWKSLLTGKASFRDKDGILIFPERYFMTIDTYLSAPRRVVIGSSIYYGTWIAITFCLTVFAIFYYFL